MVDFKNSWYIFLILAVASYLVGCFNFALLISKIKHKDVRKMGSGNPGTMNMRRQFGLKIGAATLFLDMFKGGIMVLVGYFVFKGKYFAGTCVLASDFARYLCGVCVIIGHIYPVTMRFKGGKGIASTLGMFWFAITCEVWWAFFIVLALLILTFVYIIISEWGSMGSLLGVSMLTVVQGLIFYFRYQNCLNEPWVIVLFALLVLDCFLTWFAHRKNIIALLSGEEHHTSVKKLSKGKKES